jgi:hypothetical protein
VRKVFTIHGNPFATHHKASTDRAVPFGRSEGPDGYVTSPGSLYVDVWGEEGGVYVANDTELGSTYYETLSGEEVKASSVGEISTKSWSNGSDLAISWELDGHTVYVNGISYDISRCSGDVYACALMSEQSAMVFHCTSKDTYAFTSVSLANDINGSTVRASYSVTITNPVLFSGFSTTVGKLFLITTPDTGSEVYLYTHNVPVWNGQKLYTVPPLTVDADFSYSKATDYGSFSETGVTNISGSFVTTHTHGRNIQNDSVKLTGDRIVACSCYGGKLSLLIQRHNGTVTRSVDKPQYSYGEYFGVHPNPIFALGFQVGIRYNYAFGSTAFDSGKLVTSLDTVSESSFYTLSLIENKGAVTQEVLEDTLPSGSFSSTTYEYTRSAKAVFNTSGVEATIVPPYDAILTIIPTYTESGNTRTRTFNNAIKVYCADTINNVYLFQRFNGASVHKFITYSQGMWFAEPDPMDIPDSSPIYSGTIDTVLRAGGVDYVLHSRPYQEEVGTPFAQRMDLNWQPTMPYYTQPQGPYRNVRVDKLGEWTNSENKTINKSVNLAFKGRYIDADAFKVLATFDYRQDGTENDIAPSLNFQEFEDVNKLKYNETWTDDYQPKAWQLIKGWGQFTSRAGFKTVEASGSVFVSPAVTQYPFKTLPVSLRMVP